MNYKIVMYRTENGLVKMTESFWRDRFIIFCYIKNIFSESGLTHSVVVANFATTVAGGGKTYRVDYYNLDIIISGGYRVRFLRGI